MEKLTMKKILPVLATLVVFLDLKLQITSFLFSRWYDEHLTGAGGDLRVRTVLLTNDKANKVKAENEGIIVYTSKHTLCCVLC